MEKGLRDGTLLQGKVRINANRRSTAFVTADGGVLPSDIFLENEKARNRALEGDLVRFISVETPTRPKIGMPNIRRINKWILCRDVDNLPLFPFH